MVKLMKPLCISTRKWRQRTGAPVHPCTRPPYHLELCIRSTQMVFFRRILMVLGGDCYRDDWRSMLVQVTMLYILKLLHFIMPSTTSNGRPR